MVKFKQTCILIAFCATAAFFVGLIWSFSTREPVDKHRARFEPLRSTGQLASTTISSKLSQNNVVEFIAPNLTKRYDGCNIYNDNCISLNKCGYSFYTELRIHIPPTVRFVDKKRNATFLMPENDKQQVELLAAIRSSSFYTEDDSKACFFVPPFSLLNAKHYTHSTLLMLSSLRRSNQDDYSLPEHKNLLWFNFISNLNGSNVDNSPLLTNASLAAVVISAHFVGHHYRRQFDVSIPMLNPFLSRDANDEQLSELRKHSNKKRKWLVIAHMPYYSAANRRFVLKLSESFPNTIKLIRWCNSSADYACSYNNSSLNDHGSEQFHYPQILTDAEFCLILPGTSYSPMFLREALMTGCIPLVAYDDFIMPFEDVIDWTRAAVFSQQSLLFDIFSANVLQNEQQLVAGSSSKFIECWRRQGLWLYEQYFRNITVIVDKVFKVLEQRLYPHKRRPYKEWNGGFE